MFLLVVAIEVLSCCLYVLVLIFPLIPYIVYILMLLG